MGNRVRRWAGMTYKIVANPEGRFRVDFFCAKYDIRLGSVHGDAFKHATGKEIADLYYINHRKREFNKLYPILMDELKELGLVPWE